MASLFRAKWARRCFSLSLNQARAKERIGRTFSRHVIGMQLKPPWCHDTTQWVGWDQHQHYQMAHFATCAPSSRLPLLPAKRMLITAAQSISLTCHSPSTAFVRALTLDTTHPIFVCAFNACFGWLVGGGEEPVGAGWSASEVLDYVQNTLQRVGKINIWREELFWEEIYYGTLADQQQICAGHMAHRSLRWDQTQCSRKGKRWSARLH